MNLRRTIPPAAAPLDWTSIAHGLSGIVMRERYRNLLERELRDYLGVRYVYCVSSGKAALTVILRALKTLAPGRTRALIPAYTCFSVPSAVVKAGLTISLCDVDTVTFDFAAGQLAPAVSDDTLCVIPDHLFGIPADMEAVNKLCKGRGIFVVEDAAQAMGGATNGKRLGTIGDAGFFSLGRGKNITCGSGGIIVTNSDAIARAVEKEYSLLQEYGLLEVIREFVKVVLLGIFIRPSLYWFPAGLPFLKLGETRFYREFLIKKLSGMHAGLLRDFPRRLEASNRERGKNADWFNKKLHLKPAHGALIPLLRLPFLTRTREEKDRLLAGSRKQGLGMCSLYPAPINQVGEIRDQFTGADYPGARTIADRLLTLPTHHLLSPNDRERIRGFLSQETIDRPVVIGGERQ